MKRNLDEQKIRQWFRDTRQRDELNAPAFAATLAAAQSKTQGRGWRLNARRIALATVVLMAIGIAAFTYFKRSTTERLNQAAAGQSPKLSLDDSHPRVAVQRSVPGDTAPPMIKEPRANSKPSRHRLRDTRLQIGPVQAALLSFKWQSPTDFLLRTPGVDLLKAVPRVGDSIIQFDVIPVDEKN